MTNLFNNFPASDTDFKIAGSVGDNRNTEQRHFPGERDVSLKRQRPGDDVAVELGVGEQPICH